MLITQSQKQAQQNTGCPKNLMKLAYYLFKSEIPHTTSNWPDLVATSASVDGSGDFLRTLATKPQNAHFLPSSSITGFLDAFEEAVSAHIGSKLSEDEPYSVCADEGTDVNGRAVLSTFIRHISACHESFQVEETFISAVSLETTKAEDITNTLIGELRKVGLKIENISAVSFDGCANFSGNVSGVRARLKEYTPDLLFVHCRSHLLKVALVHSCRQTPPIKRVLSALNKLCSTFRGSHKRLTILQDAHLEMERLSHKLVQPGETRWLCYEGSVKVVVEHYSSICSALEHVYTDVGDHSSDARGLLLLFRKKSTLFILVLLSRLLGRLARLSKCLQSSKGNLSEAMKLVRAVMSSLEEIRVEDVRMEAQKLVEEIQENQLRMDDDETISDADLLKLDRVTRLKSWRTCVQGFATSFKSWHYCMTSFMQSRRS
ncbi:hypothetical protein HPB48_015830 [Haemaphysalis longicornis]|uniref:DUF4371 domain-containing protein n=1 Tax=Haemaphysalis longicornis TaxID=44386 RepID=A0A9J6FBV6_HAELO|nr:hypothetical protein HPB48_015830 [Haemaphysalis longicornis]